MPVPNPNRWHPVMLPDDYLRKLRQGLSGGNQGRGNQSPHFGKLRDILASSARPFDIPARESIMSAMRPGTLLFLLLAGNLSASASGVLTGRVRDAETGAPLAGASVIIDGTEYGNLSDENGRYVIVDLPDSTWTAIALHMGYDDTTQLFSTVAGCTARLDLHIHPTHPTTESLSRSAESLLQSRLGIDTIHVDTVAAPPRTDDTATMSRSNRARRALLESYLQGGRYRAAVTLELWQERSMRGDIEQQDDRAAARFRPKSMVAAGKGLCFYREWFYYGGDYRSDAWPDDLTSEVTSVTVGYFRADSFGNQEFVAGRGSYPKDKWLVLKLTLLNGRTVLF